MLWKLRWYGSTMPPACPRGRDCSLRERVDVCTRFPITTPLKLKYEFRNNRLYTNNLHGMYQRVGTRISSYKRLKGRSHTVEKQLNMHPHKPHATGQPSRLSHTYRPSTHSQHNQHTRISIPNTDGLGYHVQCPRGHARPLAISLAISLAVWLMECLRHPIGNLQSISR